VYSIFETFSIWIKINSLNSILLLLVLLRQSDYLQPWSAITYHLLINSIINSKDCEFHPLSKYYLAYREYLTRHFIDSIDSIYSFLLYLTSKFYQANFELIKVLLRSRLLPVIEQMAIHFIFWYMVGFYRYRPINLYDYCGSLLNNNDNKVGFLSILYQSKYYLFYFLRDLQFSTRFIT